MKKIKLEILGLQFSQSQSGAYALVLSDQKGKRRLPIIIGGFEAQAIAIELEKMTPSRPLTHDLFKSFAASFNVIVKEVIIYNLVEGVFYAKLICENSHPAHGGSEQGKSGEIEIDARTSDAVAIALRFGCPIFTYEFILSTAGILLEEKETEPVESSKDRPRAKKPAEELSALTDYTIKELEELLDKAVKDEAYERASLLRDELKRRKGNNS